MNINLENYEAWLIDRMEGQLSPEQLIELDRFLEKNPSLQKEASLLEMTRIEPDLSVIFAGKESLKKEEGGKVLMLSTYMRWASAVAAMLVVFVGVRLMTNNRDQLQTAEIYTTDSFGLQVPVRTSDSLEILPEFQPFINQQDNHFAQQKSNSEKSIEQDIVPEQQEFMANNTGLTIDLKSLEQLPPKEIRPRLKMSDFDAQYAVLYNYNYENMMNGLQKQNPETIVDKWNDAVALVNDMSGVLGIGRKPATAESNQDRYKTTSIRFLGIEYYNRKRINN